MFMRVRRSGNEPREVKEEYILLYLAFQVEKKDAKKSTAVKVVQSFFNVTENPAVPMSSHKIKLVFGDGLGECHGTVTGVHKREHGPESLFAVAWTCSPRHDEAFQSVLPPEVVVSSYFRGRERPDWMSDRARYERGLDCPLFSAPAGAQLLDFELPVEAEMFFPWVKGQRGDRWGAAVAPAALWPGNAKSESMRNWRS